VDENNNPVLAAGVSNNKERAKIYSALSLL